VLMLLVQVGNRLHGLMSRLKWVPHNGWSVVSKLFDGRLQDSTEQIGFFSPFLRWGLSGMCSLTSPVLWSRLPWPQHKGFPSLKPVLASRSHDFTQQILMAHILPQVWMVMTNNKPARTTIAAWATANNVEIVENWP